VEVAYRQPSQGPVEHLVIDSTGLKVYGEGELKVKKHGAEKRRVWCKLHLAVDAKSHQIISAVVSLESVHNSEALPTMLNPLRRQIKQCLIHYDARSNRYLLMVPMTRSIVTR